MTKLFCKTTKNNQTKYYLLFVPIFKKVLFQNKALLFFMGIKFFQYKIKTDFILKLNADVAKTTLVIDHSLGGGTEVYFRDSIKKIAENNNLLRIQAIQGGYYKVSTYYKDTQSETYLETLSEVEATLSKLAIFNVIINSIVGYENIKAIFDFAIKFKNKIRVNVHDYYSICPNIFLLNERSELCDYISTKECCENVSSKITIWRDLWSNFYTNYADEIVVFSHSSKDILTKVYPNTEAKIKIEPHSIKEFENVKKISQKKKSKSTINIGVLGDITTTHKGENILSEMASLLKSQRLDNVKITVIGSYNKKNNIVVTGKYSREDLPELINRHEIDIVFIPSICSETYSYTTSEAILLNMPIACFNLGAPAERVSEHKKGLIISTINSKIALKEIINFVDELAEI